MRLDIWLTKNRPKCTRKQAKKLIDSGRVSVNGKKVRIAGWEVEAGDKVKVKEALPKATGFVKVIHEDRDIIVVDKPAGVLSVNTEGSGKGSLQDMVMAYLRRKYAQGRASYLKPVHRLDSETSGVMVFAKSGRAEKLEEQFKRHQIGRVYLALVQGRIEPDQGRIDLPLAKGNFQAGQKAKVSQEPGSRRAITDYRVKEYYSEASLIEVMVHTGRTHQIRVHLAGIGFPIVGDKVYGSAKIKFPRQALHSHLLGFKHPASGKFVRYRSPLPKDMQRLIDELREGV